MLKILGIDPGSRVTGFGLIECDANRIRYLDSGVIRLDQGDLPERLLQIYEGISAVIEQHRPTIAAIEKVFVSINPRSALKIGHARGSAICACAAKKLTISEYAAREIKQSVTGIGSADKDQVKYMVQMLLQLEDIRTRDESDALAVAITHYQRMPMLDSIKDSHHRISPSEFVPPVTS